MESQRQKKNKEKFEIIAKTFYGFEDTLSNEINQLGGEIIEKANRAVIFKGDTQMLYSANYFLRTALSILKPISKFEANDENELYKKAYEIKWEDFFNIKNTFSVETTVNSSVFRHSQYAGLKIKDAIVDRFRSKFNKRPFIDTENPDILINLHISERKITISFNSSGEPLFKRGYRIAATEAPLNEVLAAGLVMLSGWDKRVPLIDPMCGSGTILIEAALIAMNIPPGIIRKKFGFESWPDFDQKLFDKITKEESNDSNNQEKIKLIGIDINKNAIIKAKKNVSNIFLSNYINLINDDFFNYQNNFSNGIIIVNPPYGIRIGKENINDFYKEIGNKLKRNFVGFDAWIISANLEAIKRIGLHPSKKIKLYNGSQLCLFNKYEIYNDSKKQKLK